MWIRGHDKIFETPTGFIAANENGEHETQLKTFAEAEKVLDSKIVD